MSFAPGQFITAQRLNRLQPKKYFGQSSGNITAVASGNVTGTAISIPVETNGATATFWWTCACYATGAMATAVNTTAKWDVNSSPTFAVAQLNVSGEKAVVANTWSTSIPTAGTYTFQLAYVNVANANIQIYTALVVEIAEVA